MLTTAELFARRQLKLTEKKETIAEVATLVIENPEENVRSQRVSGKMSHFRPVWPTRLIPFSQCTLLAGHASHYLPDNTCLYVSPCNTDY